MQCLHQTAHAMRPVVPLGNRLPSLSPCTPPIRPCRHVARGLTIYDPSGLAPKGIPGLQNLSEEETEAMLKAQVAQEEQDEANGVERVSINDLPKAHPKAQKTLNKSLNKAGVYKALLETLGSVSFTVACDDHELGWEVTQGLSQRIGWFPVSTGRVLAGMHKVAGATPASPGTGGVGGTVPDRALLLQTLGSEAELAKAEQGVLSGLRSQKRVIACTLPEAALSQADTWREVFGTFTVWVDEDDKATPKPKSAARQLLSRHSEVMVRLKKQRGFQGGNQTTQDKAKVVLDALLKDLVTYLNDNPDIIERKVKYVAYGCRGDWPEVQPASWSPVLEGFSRAPIAGAPTTTEAAAAQPPAGPATAAQ